MFRPDLFVGICAAAGACGTSFVKTSFVKDFPKCNKQTILYSLNDRLSQPCPPQNRQPHPP